MKIKVSRRVWISAAITLVLVALTWAVSATLAQGPGGDEIVLRPAGGSAVTAFTYQGLLQENGQPVDGTYDFEFTIWDNDPGGSAVASSCPGCYSSISVEDGIFTLNIMISGGSLNDVFSGGYRWIQIEARPTGTTSWQTFPRQPISPAPYAWGLYPGTVITGTPTGWQGYVFKTAMTGAYPMAAGILGTAATGSAVLGESTGGQGVLGMTETGYGVYGYDGGTDEARGYAGYFKSENGVGVYGQSNGTREHDNIYSPGVYGRSIYGVGVYGRSDSNDSTWTDAGVMGWGYRAPGGKFLSYSGNLIEGWEDVTGDGLDLQQRFMVQWDGDVYADRAYHCGLGTGSSSEPGTCVIQNSPADFAEVLPAEGDPEPGDVLVVAPDGMLVPSSEPYQSTVVGIYSTEPGYVGNGQLLEEEGHVPLAVVGLVPVKVSAENGPIVPGDLLVASATPGHAMRAKADPPVGTVVGKALEPLESGTGVINMLVLLQ